MCSKSQKENERRSTSGKIRRFHWTTSTIIKTSHRHPSRFISMLRRWGFSKLQPFSAMFLNFQLVFMGRLGEEPISAHFTLTNRTCKPFWFKIKVSSRELFKVRPTNGKLENSERVVIRVSILCIKIEGKINISGDFLPECQSSEAILRVLARLCVVCRVGRSGKV